MRTKILVIGQDVGVLKLLLDLLALEGFEAVQFQQDGDELIAQLRDSRAALVVADAHPPEFDALPFCQTVRAITDVPIMVMSTLGDPTYAARVLRSGADDFLRKPVDNDEFVQRVHAILRRTRPALNSHVPIAVGPLHIDGDQHLAMASGTEIPLTPTEFTLLLYLAQHQSRVLTHEQMLEAVWGAEYTDSLHMLQVVMSRLRQKLDAALGTSFLQTVPGVGYRLAGA